MALANQRSREDGRILPSVRPDARCAPNLAAFPFEKLRENTKLAGAVILEKRASVAPRRACGRALPHTYRVRALTFIDVSLAPHLCARKYAARSAHPSAPLSRSPLSVSLIDDLSSTSYRATRQDGGDLAYILSHALIRSFAPAPCSLTLATGPSSAAP